MSDTKQQVMRFIVETWLNGDERGLDATTNLQESGLLDSLTTLALISFLEETFGIQLDAADIHADSFVTVDAIAALVEEKRGGG